MRSVLLASMILLCVCLLCVCLPVSVFSAEITVLPDGSGDYPTIQAAIDAADPEDMILLGDGVFRGDGNRDLDLGGKLLVILSESESPADCVIDCEGSPGQPRRAFHFHTGETENSVIVGITMKNGFGENGGAVLCEDGAVAAFANCRFEANGAVNGGAIFCESAQSFIGECEFTDNFAESGGALYASGSTISIIGGSFIGNTAGEGGAVASYQSTTWIYGSLFDRNVASAGGGACLGSTGALYFFECTLSGNESPLGIIDGRSSTVVGMWTTVIAVNDGPSIRCEPGGDFSTYCCNIWGNAGGDWTDCLEGQDEMEGNLSVNPLFCDPASGDFTLCADSPCLPQNNECDTRIGALDDGCAPCGPSPVEVTSWGALKARFRG